MILYRIDIVNNVTRYLDDANSYKHIKSKV